LSIKKHLKGRKAKKIESNQTETAIQNQENDIKKFPKKIGNIYFQNNKIDNLIINQFTNLSEDKRSNYIIKTSGAEIIINENSFENMKQVLVDENPIVKTIKQKPISVDLLVKKPDLLGDSKWQFIYNKNIEAKIEDELFLEKVRNRQIVILAIILVSTSFIAKLNPWIKTDQLSLKYRHAQMKIAYNYQDRTLTIHDYGILKHKHGIENWLCYQLTPALIKNFGTI
jgi:hypothetical protein